MFNRIPTCNVKILHTEVICIFDTDVCHGIFICTTCHRNQRKIVSFRVPLAVVFLLELFVACEGFHFLQQSFLLLPDPFREMGGWRETMEPQKAGSSLRPGPKVVEKKEVGRIQCTSGGCNADK